MPDRDSEGVRLIDDILCCSTCDSHYLIGESSVFLMPGQVPGRNKEAIQTFWRELLVALHAEDNAQLSRQELADALKDLEAMFRNRRHLAVTEMPLAQLKGADVLEIGSGNGAHSALFAYLHGAKMTAIDITPSRVLATSQKLDLLMPNGDHLCANADAERLPFADETFDVVYSNGVLHHTPGTSEAVKEVYRVLRPGGLAVVMLSAPHSFQYWINIVLLAGILKGGILKGRDWVGRFTEWMASTPQRVFNPVTKVYSERELRALFFMFNDLRVRKNSFRWELFPGQGGLLRERF